jgi:hypothetical protein
MSNFFDSPRLTLKRAMHHIDDLAAQIIEFRREAPWSLVVVESETESPKKVHKLKFDKPLPETWACIVFDAVNNLRATLDQIGYGSAIASGKAEPEGTNFPFGKDADGVENVLRKNKADRSLPPDIIDLFRSVEPYEKGNGQILWAINKLCNAKKHCALVPTRITGAQANFTAWVPDDTVAGTGLGGSNWMPNELELILMVLPPDINPKITGNLSINISVDTLEIVRNKPIVGVLRGAVDTINGLLISAEAICQRLGPIQRQTQP